MASDSDRSLAVAALREAAGAGVFGLDELEIRLGAVLRAATVADLVELTWDARPEVVTAALARAGGAFPVARAGAGALAGTWPPGRLNRWSRLRQKAGFRYHSTVYLLTNGFLVGTWAVTTPGHFFWPFFPAAGWGIALGIHASVTSHHIKEEDAEAAVAAAGPGVALSMGAVGAVGPARRRDREETGVRYVVALFADISNSTALNEAMGDQAWSRLRTRHLDMLRRLVDHHHGQEVSAQGDGLFARFEHPLASVSCAVAIQRDIHQQLESTGFAPRVRIGIHAGEAIEDDADLIGQTVNLAARVAALAGPDEICVTEPVADKLGERFELEDLGLHHLKGVARPRHLLAVHW